MWDYDKAYANLDGINESVKDLCYLMQRSTDPTMLFWYLNTHDEFRQSVSACYEAFFSDYMQTIQDEKIDEYVSEIEASRDMDLIRWKKIYGEKVDYGREVQRIRDFLASRKLFLDEVWAGDKEICTVCFLSEEGFVSNYVSVIKGACMERLPGAEPGTVSGDRMFDGWYTQEGTRFDTTTPVLTDMAVCERRHEVSRAD